MPKHVAYTIIQTPAGTLTTKAREFSGEGNIELDVPITGPVTNKEVTLALDISALKFLALLLDTAGTVKTNSTGSPDATIPLIADVPYMGDETNNANITALTADVTKVYITIAATGSFVFKVRALADVTP